MRVQRYRHYVPYVFAVNHHEKCEFHHVPAGRIVVRHQIQSSRYVRVTIVVAQVVLEKQKQKRIGNLIRVSTHLFHETTRSRGIDRPAIYHSLFVNFTSLRHTGVPSLYAALGFRAIQLPIFRGLAKRHLVFRDEVRATEISYHSRRRCDAHVSDEGQKVP